MILSNHGDVDVISYVIKQHPRKVHGRNVKRADIVGDMRSHAVCYVIQVFCVVVCVCIPVNVVVCVCITVCVFVYVVSYVTTAIFPVCAHVSRNKSVQDF